MVKIVFCTIKPWNIDLAKIFQKKYMGKFDVTIISEKNQLTSFYLNQIKPDFIFFPHWSFIIPEDIYSQYNCIVFHMTDLPYGRGGSPLQNLIIRGKTKTKISAIKVTKELDAGPVYLKENLTLDGSASDIFIRAANIIFDKMIPYIVENKPVPVEQEGKITIFSRRKPYQSELQKEFGLTTFYDYIRMLDAEGYPNAYINYGTVKISFSKASLKNGKLIAEAEIIEQEKIIKDN